MRALIALGVAALGAASSSLMAAERPNVLMLNVDDLKVNLGCYGDKFAKSPNIDRLASRGTVMMSNYCQQAVCAPSRISVFTGLRPDSTGVWDLHTHMRDVNPDVLTMFEHFKTNGYETVGMGKLFHGAKGGDPQSWTMLIDEKDLPYNPKHGLPAWGKYQGEHVKKTYAEVADKKMGYMAMKDHMEKNNAKPSSECFDLPDDAYQDGAIAVEGMHQLESFAKSGKPFFLALGFRKPHLPFNAPKKYWDMYDRKQIKVHPFQSKPANGPDLAMHSWGELKSYSDIDRSLTSLSEEKQKELIHGYYACMSFTDVQIGKVLNKLDELDLSKNTIIVLWGDHGWHLGDHGLWCKHSNFEQATRSPLIFAAPGFKGGQKTKSSTEFVDIFPTLCDLAGIDKPKHLEGDSLVGIMDDPEQSIKDYSVSQWLSGKVMGYAFRTERYRFVMWIDGYRSFMKFDPDKVVAVELYDYDKDPMEKVNLASNPEQKVVVDKFSKMAAEYFARYESMEKETAMMEWVLKGKGQKKEKKGAKRKNK